MGVFIIIGAVLAALLLLTKKAEGATRGLTPIPTVERVNSVELLILENAKRFSLDPALIKAFIKVESDFDPNAVNPKDPSYGLMQITPILAEDYGIVKDHHNPTEAEIAMIKLPSTNIRIGSWFISKLTAKYPFDIAVQMYNVGENGYLAEGHRAADYLSKIKRFYNEYQSD